MMHRCFRINDPHGEEMLNVILRESLNIRKVDHLISEPHPHAVVLWHLAASLAHRKGREKIAEELFNYSVKALSDRGELFWTIKMAVQAEMIALGLEGKMPGNSTSWQNRSEEFFSKMYPVYAERATHNPFTNIQINDHSTLLETLYRFADRIVY